MRPFPWRRCAPSLVLLAVMQLGAVNAAERASSKRKGDDKEAVENEYLFYLKHNMRLMRWLETNRPAIVEAIANSLV